MVSTDACGIVTNDFRQDNFTCESWSKSPLHPRVTNGNSATKTAIVTVEDKIAPVVLTKNITVQLNAAGYCFDSCIRCKQWFNRCSAELRL
jgi:hypothetical protein